MKLKDSLVHGISWVVGAAAGMVPSPVSAHPSGRILVVLSSESKITLKDGLEHPTGFFLSELMGPVKVLAENGYELVFANPKGTRAVLDKGSDSARWFGDIEGASLKTRQEARHRYGEIRALCQRLHVCGGPGALAGENELRDLGSILKEGLENYDGVFLPGGHAPMEDLWKDPNMGRILRYFHGAKKPTALICHAPVALLAALDAPEAYISGIISDDRRAIVRESRGWIYQGYAMTSFTTREEQQEESEGQDGNLGGFVRFYPDEVLEKAGAYLIRADKWKSNVVVSHELITGQNPFSHDALAAALLKQLEGGKQSERTRRFRR